MLPVCTMKMSENPYVNVTKATRVPAKYANWLQSASKTATAAPILFVMLAFAFVRTVSNVTQAICKKI